MRLRLRECNLRRISEPVLRPGAKEPVSGAGRGAGGQRAIPACGNRLRGPPKMGDPGLGFGVGRRPKMPKSKARDQPSAVCPWPEG